MKIIYLYFLALLFLLTSCSFLYFSSTCERGNGKIIKKSYVLGEFNKIICSSSADIFIKKGESDSIVIETDENLFEIRFFDVKNNTFYFDPEESICPTYLRIFITMKELAGIKINGSAKVVAEGDFNPNKAYFLINGAGDIKVDSINAKDMFLEINGSGNISIKGNVNSNNIKISGSGDVEAFELVSNKTKVRILGSGEAFINVSDKLDAEIIGSGDIIYIGNPQTLRSNVVGSGDIKPKK